MPSSTTRSRRSSSWVTLQHHGTGRQHCPRLAWGAGFWGWGRSRGVGVLQEAELVPLAIGAQRLHDGQDAGGGERRCSVEGWAQGRGEGPGAGTDEERGEETGRGEKGIESQEGKAAPCSRQNRGPRVLVQMTPAGQRSKGTSPPLPHNSQSTSSFSPPVPKCPDTLLQKFRCGMAHRAQGSTWAPCRAATSDLSGQLVSRVKAGPHSSLRGVSGAQPQPS